MKTRKCFLNTDLSDFPFGWENIYQEALSEHPEGITLTEIFSHPLAGDQPQYLIYRTDPVGYRSMLLREYRLCQDRGNALVNQFRLSGDLSLLSELIAEDIKLYILACSWCSEYIDPNDSGDHLNPEEFLSSKAWLEPNLGYFVDHIPEPHNWLLQYRLIDWTLDIPGRQSFR